MLEAQADAVDEGLLLVGRAGQIISFNRRFAEMWSFDEELMSRQSDDAALEAAVAQLVDPDAFLSRVRYLYDHPEELSTDVLHFRDGRVVERYSAPVRSPDGNHYGRLWSFRDVTARVEAERALRRRATEQAALYHFTDQVHRASTLDDVYRAAIESILAALECDRASLLLFDERKVMRFVASHGLSDAYRAAVEGHTPWGPDDADATPIAVHDIAESDLEPELKATVLDEGIGAFAFVPLAADRRLIGKFMVYFDAPHRFVDEELRLAFTIARQIAFGIQRRRADEERIRAEEALREADRRKDEFLATLAHELRNPLAPIRNALPLIQSRLAAGEEVGRLLDILDRQSEHLARLVDDLMDVSRITRGHVDLRREPVDLGALVERVLAAATEQVGATRELSSRVPAEPVLVEGDPVRLEQVLHNLVANAVKYSDAGGHIRVTVERDGDRARVGVADDGIGIDNAFVGQLFEPFQQADRSLDRSQGGLGIGLTIAKRLIELHGGTISARSEGLGRGSEFSVVLPTVAGSVGAPAEPAAEPGATPARAEAALRVLIVDDNPDQTAIMAELITRLGHETRVAADGRQAIAIAGKFRPEIVLLDIGLPVVSGYEVARELRRRGGRTRPRIVAVTGYGQASDRQRSAAAGFDAHVVKPLDIGALQRLLEREAAG